MLLFFIMMSLTLAGCVRVREVSSSWDEFPQDPKSAANGGNPGDPTAGYGWTLQLAEFTGRNRYGRAFKLTGQARRQAGLADLWVEDTGDTSIIYAGRFGSRDNPRAQQELTTARNAQINNARPFADARLVRANSRRQASADPLDLRQYTGYFSLQVAFFDAQYTQKDYRRAAEDMARRLRKQGYEAYYYHGPNRSLVTIGTYTRGQAFVVHNKMDAYAPQVTELQEHFPYNRGNGLILNKVVNGKIVDQQPSFLIRVF